MQFPVQQSYGALDEHLMQYDNTDRRIAFASFAFLAFRSSSTIGILGRRPRTVNSHGTFFGFSPLGSLGKTSPVLLKTTP